MDALLKYVDTSKTSLYLCVASVAFNPTAWNIVARNEYHNKTITRLFGGNPYRGTYFLAACIFGAGIFRDHLYKKALLEQPRVPLIPEPYNVVIPVAIFAVGQVFVVTSTWALGITGTFLGDYFGILMDHRVEGFPFNFLRNPMYVGSTMSFAATALWYERPAGLLITLYVYVVYTIALRFEGPFTDMIYAKRASRPTNSSKKEL
ncbi:phospholipid methyltransferase [Vararia minispora EC-137]|uniref:Phospholipid methyltransferase n=1 Tax=Vararia minispora EC-137 TaxID=1314806 RepID=A0ACB8QB85_9AGAM|nr:phospholipid methyltransferase [Vararia minispora EC-137]